MKIKQAKTKAELEDVRRLFLEYETFLGVDLCFQGFDHEVATLPGKYAAPHGDLLIGVCQGKAVGCVAVRKLDEDACEMKRLFVQPAARGTGLGRALAQAAIRAGRELGYAVMKLDTLERLQGAMHLYESLGFHKTAAYYDNPTPDVTYWERDLNVE